MAIDSDVVESDIFEAMLTQRAIRRFRPDPVPRYLIKKVLAAATRAPNGGNVQPWRFLVVEDAEKKRALQRIYSAEWDKYLAMDRGPQPTPTPEEARSRARTLAAGQHLADHLHEVPVIIIPCGFLLAVNTGIASGSSIYPAIQNLMLAARAVGLGTVLTTLHRHNEDAVRALLGIPENAHTAALIPLGWPSGHFGAGPRLPVEAVTYWDGWGVKEG